MDPSRIGRLPPPFSFHPMQPLQEHHHHQDQQLQQNSEEEYSNSSGPNMNPNTDSSKGNGNNKGMHKKGLHNKLMEGGEVVRKPRGRPPGSKNKPKPPIIITRETGTGMRPHVLEIASGCDVHECIATFARRRQRSLCVLGASGTVSNVTLRQTPGGGNSGGSSGGSGSGSVLTLHGRFDILSMSGTFMQPSQPQPLMPMPMPSSTPSLFGGGSGPTSGGGNAHQVGPSSGLSISMAGTQGQVIGGIVVGALMSVSPILVIAASFLGPCTERLPLDEHEQDMLNGNGGNPHVGPSPHHHLALSSGPGSGQGGVSNVPNDPCAMSLYNIPQVQLGNQITPDMLAWAAAAGGRPPF